MTGLMRMEWAGTVRRLVVGVFLLMALSFTVSAPAFTHGHRHGGPGRPTQISAGAGRTGPVADNIQAFGATPPHTLPGSSRQSGGCPACCDMGQCFAPAVALPGHVSVAM